MELSRTLQLIEQGIRDGSHAGAQLYVSRAGTTFVELAVGESRPGVAMSPNTLNAWLSSGKPVAAVAIAQLWERGRLQLDDPVVRYIPEFAPQGKERVTIRHLLTHSAGLRAFALNYDRPVDQILTDLYAQNLEPDWEPGHRAGYHSLSTWFILGELVRRLDERRRTFNLYARQTIFEQTGMRDAWIGMPPDQFAAYERAGRIGLMYDTSKSPPDVAHARRADAAALGFVSPGANLRATARDLGRFYEMLLDHGDVDGSAVLSPQTVEAMTARHRVGMHDRTFGRLMDWGLGFIIDSKHYAAIGADRPDAPPVPYGYGPHASPRTFGHSGNQSSCAFADPEHQLVVAWVCNGMPGEPRHQARQDAINAAIYADLQIASSG
jgi:CubicO group peptidase (beta-lactamase class C family)